MFMLQTLPWHVVNDPKIEYSKRVVEVTSQTLPLESTMCDDAELVRVVNLSVKRFRRLLRKRRWDRGMQLFQVIQVNAMKRRPNVETKDQLLRIPH